MEEFELPYQKLEDFDDVFVYLCPMTSGTNPLNMASMIGVTKKVAGAPISYSKFKATDFGDLNPELKWVELTADPVAGIIKSPEKAGVLGFRATLVRGDSGVKLTKELPWKKKLRKRPNSSKIRCFVF